MDGQIPTTNPKEYPMKKSQMARIVELDRIIRNMLYPGRDSFGVAYGVSGRTVARDLEYLRDRLQAPLAYDPCRRGYFYSQPWELPGVVRGEKSAEDRLLHIVEQLKRLSEKERAAVFAALSHGKPAHGEIAGAAAQGYRLVA